MYVEVFPTGTQHVTQLTDECILVATNHALHLSNRI